MPVIGITTAVSEKEFLINKHYVQAVAQNGGLPLMITCLPFSEEQLDQYMEMMDGLIFSGGGDMDPVYFGEDRHPKTDSVWPERDELELRLFKKAYGKIPILGICRGMQLMNVALGGTLVQHIENHSLNDRRFEPVHNAMIDAGCVFGPIYGESVIGVNSIHHQALGKPGKGVHVCIKAEDGTPEGIFLESEIPAMGVQWHPEALFRDMPSHRALFQYFIDKCEKGVSS